MAFRDKPNWFGYSPDNPPDVPTLEEAKAWVQQHLLPDKSSMPFPLHPQTQQQGFQAFQNPVGVLDRRTTMEGNPVLSRRQPRSFVPQPGTSAPWIDSLRDMWEMETGGFIRPPNQQMSIRDVAAQHDRMEALEARQAKQQPGMLAQNQGVLNGGTSGTGRRPGPAPRRSQKPEPFKPMGIDPKKAGLAGFLQDMMQMTQANAAGRDIPMAQYGPQAYQAALKAQAGEREAYDQRLKEALDARHKEAQIRKLDADTIDTLGGGAGGAGGAGGPWAGTSMTAQALNVANDVMTGKRSSSDPLYYQAINHLQRQQFQPDAAGNIHPYKEYENLPAFTGQLGMGQQQPQPGQQQGQPPMQQPQQGGEQTYDQSHESSQIFPTADTDQGPQQFSSFITEKPKSLTATQAQNAVFATMLRDSLKGMTDMVKDGFELGYTDVAAKWANENLPGAFAGEQVFGFEDAKLWETLSTRATEALARKFTGATITAAEWPRVFREYIPGASDFKGDGSLARKKLLATQGLLNTLETAVGKEGMEWARSQQRKNPDEFGMAPGSGGGGSNYSAEDIENMTPAQIDAAYEAMVRNKNKGRR